MSTDFQGRTKLTYEDYAALPQDGMQHEIIAGEHLVSPAPGTYHQLISARLQYQLYQQIVLTGRGVVLSAPVDVQLSAHDIVQPDLVAISTPRQEIITATKIHGSPDLVIEILSPSSAKHDRSTKRALYERFAVAEYWIIDAAEQRLEQLVLDNDRYRSRTLDREVTSTSFASLRVDLAQIW